MSSIALLGTGNMGAPMAECLIAGGHQLSVYNRTRAKAEPLAELGAIVAESPRDAGEGADAIIAMVGDDEASKAVWTGETGALAANVAEGALAIECSTLSHDWVLELAGLARASGFRYIDCPVTGYPEQAAKGEIVLLAGADDADLAAAEGILGHMGAETIHFGPVGAGTAYKLMINLMGSVQIAAAAEGMLIAEKAGLDRNQVAYAISRGAAASRQVVRNTERMAAADHHENVTFSGRWRLKDTLYGLKLAEKFGQDAPFGQVARELLEKLVADGLGDENESKIIDILRS